jgi:hypothetical protein
MQQEFHTKNTTPAQQAKFLRGYVKNEIQQKVRLQETIRQYKTNHYNLNESVVDESYLKRQLEGETQTDDVIRQLNQVNDRLNRFINLRQDAANRLQELDVRHEQMTQDLQAHVIELAATEIAQGNFTAHIFGLRDNVEFDEEKNMVKFEPQGSVEVAIATDLASWKDSSQLTIIKKED